MTEPLDAPIVLQQADTFAIPWLLIRWPENEVTVQFELRDAKGNLLSGDRLTFGALPPALDAALRAWCKDQLLLLRRLPDPKNIGGEVVIGPIANPLART